ncbi:MAG: hypothetical protein K0U84_01740 [Actinomycetia bacterium]|nr:hypothetical protein [Actinomycetes bacterium]
MSAHPDYQTCRDCDREYERRFFNDDGLCAMCRMSMVMLPPNPFFTAEADK